MAEFTTDVRYLPGADNVVADALSRASIQESDTVANLEGVVTEVIDYTAMARQQSFDAGVQRLVTESSLQIVSCQLPDTREQLVVDMSTEKPRSLLPATWTRKIFDINHDLAHAGARAMRRQFVIASSGMVWPETYDSGPARAWPASARKCRNTS